jgi:xylulose-5-phosphate/fructose-6-phosphate phosphoketolase
VGLGVWAWASNDKGAEPDVVTACRDDVRMLAGVDRRASN